MADLPDIQPDYSVKKNIEPKTLPSDFGDGYSQRSADGLNHMSEMWTLSWTGRTVSEIDTLEDFFEARGGYEHFTWTPLRDTETKKYVCRKWNRTYLAPDNDNLSADITEVHDI